MDAKDVIALVAAVIAGISAVISWTAMRQTWKISQVAHIFPLHNEWEKYPGIDWNNPYANEEALRQAANLLGMMARLWKHKVIDREILYEFYWSQFKEIYDKLSNLKTQKLSGIDVTPSQLVDDYDVQDTFKAMEKRDREGKPRFRFF